MKALVVIELDLPNGGTLKELTATFDAVQEIPFKTDSRLVSRDDAIDSIRGIAWILGDSGPRYARRKKQ